MFSIGTKIGKMYELSDFQRGQISGAHLGASVTLTGQLFVFLWKTVSTIMKRVKGRFPNGRCSDKSNGTTVHCGLFKSCINILEGGPTPQPNGGPTPH